MRVRWELISFALLAGITKHGSVALVPIGGDAYLRHYECMLGSGAEESTAGEFRWLPER